MKIVRVKETGFKSKVVKGKVYVWRQYYLNVPKEYRLKPYLVVISMEEFAKILYDNETREKVKKEFDKLLEEL